MSENSMMTGYAVKMGKVDDADRIEFLFENFDDSALNKWQWMYDDSGYECIVYLTESDRCYYEGSQIVVDMNDMKTAKASAFKFADESPDFQFVLNEDDEPEFVFFFIVWYNGVEMDTIFKERK